MTVTHAAPPTERAPDQTDERGFRPDVEGLRAIAVVTVVMYHVGLHGFGGGYVGVDVFFVISGFVITMLLLRQTDRLGRPQFGDFYARRSRRILPAAGLVALGTLFASYHYLGFIRGDNTAHDTRWVAVFLGNFHFASVGTNYLNSELPPSPLQNYWSLAVEEQFYVVYPALLAFLALGLPRARMTTKLLVATAAIVAASLTFSVIYTGSHPTQAYFSTFTHAWELALGGFVAAGAAVWRRLPKTMLIGAGWVGVAMIVAAVIELSNSTKYPGWAVTLPVAGAALVILGGVRAQAAGPEVVLGSAPFRLIGKLSFSIYLWHWPVLTIASQYSSTPLSIWHKLALVGLSVVGAAATYYLVENPIRHSGWLARHRAVSIALGLVVVGGLLLAAGLELKANSF